MDSGKNEPELDPNDEKEIENRSLTRENLRIEFTGKT